MKLRHANLSLADVHIIRLNRKSFSLEVKVGGQLVVRAPKHATDKDVRAVLTQKADWIARTRAKLRRKYPDYQPKTFSPGEKFWYLGQKYPLKFTNRQRPLLALDGAFQLAQSAQKRAREVFIEWYREETRRITADLIQQYSQSHKFNPNRVRITSAKTRWGSCSSNNNLNFTYRLCMAPLSVVDYVVVHELVHLKFHNHSQSFWRAVGDIKPDYREHREWLKQYGPMLSLDF